MIFETIIIEMIFLSMYFPQSFRLMYFFRKKGLVEEEMWVIILPLSYIDVPQLFLSKMCAVCLPSITEVYDNKVMMRNESYLPLLSYKKIIVRYKSYEIIVELFSWFIRFILFFGPFTSCHSIPLLIFILKTLAASQLFQWSLFISIWSFLRKLICQFSWKCSMHYFQTMIVWNYPAENVKPNYIISWCVSFLQTCFSSLFTICVVI